MWPYITSEEGLPMGTRALVQHYINGLPSSWTDVLYHWCIYDEDPGENVQASEPIFPGDKASNANIW